MGSHVHRGVVLGVRTTSFSISSFIRAVHRRRDRLADIISHYAITCRLFHQTDPTENMTSFLDRFAEIPLGQVFADQTWISIRDSSLRWLNLPPEDFLEYARNADRAPFDSLPSDPAVFRSDATFLLAQAHRIWTTLQKVSQHLPQTENLTILDVGAYPFSIGIAIRAYLKRGCRILATVNQALSAEDSDWLVKNGIDTIPVNLDPLVTAGSPLPEMTDRLPIDDRSVDFVVFAHVIEHLYHPIRILREIFRVLKPGGKLLLSTDNAFMIGGLLNYFNAGEYLHEPVEGTAAMVFHEWRGHVRYFSEGDLRKLLETVGFTVADCELQEILYNSVPEEYFVEPSTRIPRWRAELLREFPMLRNEIFFVGEKPVPPEPVLNPFDSEINAAEIQRFRHAFESGSCGLDRATALDLAMGYRLLLGRWPTASETRQFMAAPPRSGVDGLVRELVSSREFPNRKIGIEFERPGHDCILMTETPEGLRFFFSVRDTFVGFPIAVGVFEPDVQDAFRLLVRPGMNCLDIGANLGYYSMRMASAVGPNGRVFSFEPDAFAFALLKKNSEENRFQDVISLFQIACGSEDGNAFLVRDANPANYGGMHVADGIDAPRECVRIPVGRIDTVIRAGTRIDFAKIDVEGYEPEVLKGMQRIIAENAPVLLCEYNRAALEAHGPETPNRLLEIFEDLGYSLYDASVFGQRRAIRLEDRNGIPPFANLICLPRGQSAADWF